MQIPIKLLREGAQFPARTNEGDSGLDLFACLDEPIRLYYCWTPTRIPCGIAIALPYGFEGQIRSRSGLASKGVIIPNAPGTIDQGYRGEICVLLMLVTAEYVEIKPGDRIAQLVIAPVCTTSEWAEMLELPESMRGEKGFGSSG